MTRLLAPTLALWLLRPSAASETSLRWRGKDFCPTVFPEAQIPREITSYGPPEEWLKRHRLKGTASYYSDFFEGRKTANGEIFRQAGMTAAHRTLPFGSLVNVRCRATGRSIQVRINDRGPFKGGFIIDLTRSAARTLGVDKTRDRHVDLTVMYYPE